METGPTNENTHNAGAISLSLAPLVRYRHLNDDE
jgi:hypothetical protein